MSGLDDFGSVVERHHGALSDIIGGSAQGFKALYSREDDATLANPFDPPVLGWEQIELTLERAASNYTWGEVVSCQGVTQVVTSGLADTVELERFNAQLVGMAEAHPVT